MRVSPATVIWVHRFALTADYEPVIANLRTQITASGETLSGKLYEEASDEFTDWARRQVCVCVWVCMVKLSTRMYFTTQRQILLKNRELVRRGRASVDTRVSNNPLPWLIETAPEDVWNIVWSFLEIAKKGRLPVFHSTSMSRVDMRLFS